ncbi:MAG: hypothetical protein P8N02_07820 [Actinomycetota bacterium]|nr:hypothetical protein [Actinomycetota bacterium]
MGQRPHTEPYWAVTAQELIRSVSVPPELFTRHPTIIDRELDRHGSDGFDFAASITNGTMEFLGYLSTLAADRRGCPVDDLASVLIAAEIDGAPTSRRSCAAPGSIRQALARVEIEVLLSVLLERCDGIRLVGPVERLATNFVSGIKQLPIAVS